MSEIMNCPFCNGRAIMRERFINGVANVKHYRLECVDCHASFLNWNKNTSKAIAAWNRRADHIRDTTKKVSNADRIRGMSDDEMAKEMLFFVPSDFNRHYTGLSGGYYATADEAIQASLDWLKQPVKEGCHKVS